MKIGIDFDDVIVNFIDNLMDFYHNKYGKKVTRDQIEIWNWGLYWGVSKEEATKRVDEFHESHDVKELMPLDNAIIALKDLIKRHDITIITSRPVRFKHKVEGWLEHHLGEKIEIIHAGDWHKGQAATKAEICLKLGISLIIEDSGETGLDCASKGVKVLLFDNPWNKKFSHNNIIRVNNWSEAMKKINSGKF